MRHEAVVACAVASILVDAGVCALAKWVDSAAVTAATMADAKRFAKSLRVLGARECHSRSKSCACGKVRGDRTNSVVAPGVVAPAEAAIPASASMVVRTTSALIASSAIASSLTRLVTRRVRRDVAM
eukprot:scaffold81484_cov31-Tisochrysis_lutea.AAC.2